MKGRFSVIAAAMLGAVTLAAQTPAPPAAPGARGRGAQPSAAMNDIAERYVKLVLALGQHDRDYVDAYYGPAEWKQQAESAKASLDELAERARTLLGSCLLYTSPSPRDRQKSRMPSSA